MIIHPAAEATLTTLKTVTTSAEELRGVKIEQRTFACPMLKQQTHLTIISSVAEADESLNSTPDHFIEMDCASKLRCGIARMDAQGNISYNWEMCPANRRSASRPISGDVRSPSSDASPYEFPNAISTRFAAHRYW